MEFRKSFDLILDRFGLALFCVLVDVLSFFAFGFFSFPVSAKIADLLVGFTAVFSSGLNTSDRGSASILGLLFSSDTLLFWRSFLTYALLFVLIAYVVYVVFQSVAWFVSFRIAGKKTNFWTFFLWFGLFNLFWFSLFIVYNIVDFFVDIGGVLGGNFGFVSVLNSAFLMLIFYFAVISYVKLSFLKSFVFGFRKYRQVLPSFLVVCLFFLVLNLILPFLFSVNYYFGAAVGIVLFLPSLVFARVFMIKSIERVK